MKMNEKVINSIDKNFLDWGIEKINAPSLWHEAKGEGVKVAVVDTGADISHPDLSHSIAEGLDLRLLSNDFKDGRGHGSHIAGLIAGKHTGVAPNSKLFVAKALSDDGLGHPSHIMDGITYAINYEVDVLCLCLGRNQVMSEFFQDRIRMAYRKGITIVSATGNNGQGQVDYPAFMDEVIGVGGIDKHSNLTKFSNYGQGLDVLAPAVDILSTYRDGKYARMTGTSMATGLVAGGVALIISYYRNKGIDISNTEIKKLIKQSEVLDLSSMVL